MDDIGSSLRKNILDANVEMFHTDNIEPTPISEEFVPVDLDVTPMDNSKTHKEGVSYTYKGFFGYAPMMAYIGAEGFLVNTELREGSQHCQCNTPAFLSETLNYSHQLTKKLLLVRMDSGNDAKISAIHVTEKRYTLVPHGKTLIIPISKETAKRSPCGSCMK